MNRTAVGGHEARLAEHVRRQIDVVSQVDGDGEAHGAYARDVGFDRMRVEGVGYEAAIGQVRAVAANPPGHVRGGEREGPQRAVQDAGPYRVHGEPGRSVPKPMHQRRLRLEPIAIGDVVVTAGSIVEQMIAVSDHPNRRRLRVLESDRMNQPIVGVGNRRLHVIGDHDVVVRDGREPPLGDGGGVAVVDHLLQVVRIQVAGIPHIPRLFLRPARACLHDTRLQRLTCVEQELLRWHRLLLQAVHHHHVVADRRLHPCLVERALVSEPARQGREELRAVP